ncbi:MAG: hypothetical protein ACLTSZ_06905 [Lachnospiraceae bacterium]
MHSAQCVTKNTSVCTQMPECGYLKDRKNAEFPVVNRCVTCCNTILQFRSAGSERLSEGDRGAVSELCARGVYRGIRRGDCCGIGPVKAVVCRRSNAFRIGRTGRNTGTFQKRGSNRL